MCGGACGAASRCRDNAIALLLPGGDEQGVRAEGAAIDPQDVVVAGAQLRRADAGALWCARSQT